LLFEHESQSAILKARQQRVHMMDDKSARTTKPTVFGHLSDYYYIPTIYTWPF